MINVKDYVSTRTPSEEEYRGIFIRERIFMVKDNGEIEDIKDWLKIIIKEAVMETLNGMQIIQR